MSSRDNYLKRKYGISEDQYQEMLIKQNFCCALCRRHKNEFSRRLAVEHNHKTGKVRSLCCFYCNKFRIGRHDLASAELLYAYMVDYDG